ncbi:hypothetical protein OESDEN_15829 [Oesophagostomum dentatum]|uniref:Uncharacterized protein n=1 Tax=Oesophagostomum dentatum TaxID=61180 RepID=A0A0B1SLQ0_OESDE|nr:hypothetical protein OESDEN_15829 [Oesophagostomum dentatum]
MAFMDGPGMAADTSYQLSAYETDSKNGIVDSPRSSDTPEDDRTAEEATSAGASDEVNDDYFVPTEVSLDCGPDTEPSRKRSFSAVGGPSGAPFSSKKKKNDSLQEGLDMIREVTATLREKLSAASMDKYDRYGAFVASSLRDMAEPAAKRKMAELMDVLLNNR